MIEYRARAAMRRQERLAWRMALLCVPIAAATTYLGYRVGRLDQPPQPPPQVVVHGGSGSFRVDREGDHWLVTLTTDPIALPPRHAPLPRPKPFPTPAVDL
jgi:hypothetical protein